MQLALHIAGHVKKFKTLFLRRDRELLAVRQMAALDNFLVGCIEFCGWVDGCVSIHLLYSTEMLAKAQNRSLHKITTSADRVHGFATSSPMTGAIQLFLINKFSVTQEVN
eukprot:COSAG05_NODE_11801_length_495_cov_2.858586_1_plen_109_part_10